METGGEINLLCGIDENGLGPYIGPLLITLFSDGYEFKSKDEFLTYLREKIKSQGDEKDSKKIFSRKKSDFSKIEENFFDCMKKTDFPLPETLKEIFSLSIFHKDIEKICPVKPDLFCFSEIPLPAWSEIKISQENKRLNEKTEIMFSIICPGLLRKKVLECGSKFSANAYFMVRMGMKSRAKFFICGKSGYKKSYKFEIEKAISDEDEKEKSENTLKDSIAIPKEMGKEEKEIKQKEEEDVEVEEAKINCGERKIKQSVKSDIEVLEEENVLSMYEVRGKIFCFVKDADTKFYHAAKASLIGKYIREISMLSITRFCAEGNSDQVKYPVSGYGKEKSEETVKLLKKRFENMGISVPDTCIVREY